MAIKSTSFKYLRILLIFLATYLASTVAWWWQHRPTLFSGSVEVWLDYIALGWNIPGWVIVGMFDHSEAQLRTNLTDFMIPVLSGIIWVLIALLVMRLSELLGKFAVAIRKSR